MMGSFPRESLTRARFYEGGGVSLQTKVYAAMCVRVAGLQIRRS